MVHCLHYRACFIVLWGLRNWGRCAKWTMRGISSNFGDIGGFLSIVYTFNYIALICSIAQIHKSLPDLSFPFWSLTLSRLYLLPEVFILSSSAFFLYIKMKFHTFSIISRLFIIIIVLFFLQTFNSSLIIPFKVHSNIAILPVYEPRKCSFQGTLIPFLHSNIPPDPLPSSF